jgi:catechol 2,3-dioxygenase-like lactoylglutathione lyase family enzyme
MIDHLEISVSSLPASTAFYSAALAPLGYRRYVAREALCGWGTSEIAPDFWVRTNVPAQASGTSQPGGPSQPLPHVAFNCTSRDLVRRCYQAAVATGARSRVEPTLMTQVHANYFAAQVFDPDGHNIEFACHGPE